KTVRRKTKSPRMKRCVASAGCNCATAAGNSRGSSRCCAAPMPLHPPNLHLTRTRSQRNEYTDSQFLSACGCDQPRSVLRLLRPARTRPPPLARRGRVVRGSKREFPCVLRRCLCQPRGASKDTAHLRDRGINGCGEKRARRARAGKASVAARAKNAPRCERGPALGVGSKSARRSSYL